MESVVEGGVVRGNQFREICMSVVGGDWLVGLVVSWVVSGLVGSFDSGVFALVAVVALGAVEWPRNDSQTVVGVGRGSFLLWALCLCLGLCCAVLSRSRQHVQ